MDRETLRRRLVPVVGGLGVVLATREVLARAREVDLRGQVALVTGATRGLGLALARELADEGCRLAICARDEAELQRAGEELGRSGAEVLAVRCDVGDKDDVDRLVAAVEANYGRIDLLVCNAGVIQVGQLESMELADFRQAMDIMYWGALYPILAALPGMRARRTGRIAVITSIGGKVSVPHLLPYNGAKFAAVGLAEGLRAELADEGITVTTIVPGLMRTGSYLNAFFSGDEEGRTTHYPMFVPLSSLPFLTASADGAARAYVRAIKRGEAECIYPPQYGLVARAHGLAPATTVRALAIADRLLPKSGSTQQTEPGMMIDPHIHSRVWRSLTTLGRQAAHAFRQYPGPTSIPPPDADAAP